MDEIKQKLVRRASRGALGGSRPPDSPTASWFGKVLVALPDELWPVWDGRPMIPLCQLNLTEAPYVPENLKEIALLTVFLNNEDLPISTSNGEGWLLRPYSSLSGLASIAQPELRAEGIKPFAIRWELVDEDYPCWDDAAEMDLPPEVDEDFSDLFHNIDATKLGGWPTLIQSEIYWAPHNRHPANPEYAFQINTEPKARWQWGDAGVGYFGRGTGEHTDVWTFERQCY
jgi:hypothetical protein